MKIKVRNLSRWKKLYFSLILESVEKYMEKIIFITTSKIFQKPWRKSMNFSINLYSFTILVWSPKFVRLEVAINRVEEILYNKKLVSNLLVQKLVLLLSLYFALGESKTESREKYNGNWKNMSKFLGLKIIGIEE